MEEDRRVLPVAALPQMRVRLEVPFLDRWHRRSSSFPDSRLAREKWVTLGTVAMTGCGGADDSSRRCLEPVFLADVVEKLMADSPTHAVENDQQHPIPRLDDLGDDLREHILDAA